MLMFLQYKPEHHHSLGILFNRESDTRSRCLIEISEPGCLVHLSPGHTPGSICLLTGQYLLSGDTLFPGGPGRTNSSSDFRKIVESIQTKIMILPGETKIFPGHGDSTILSLEKEEFDAFLSRSHSSQLCGNVLWQRD